MALQMALSLRNPAAPEAIPAIDCSWETGGGGSSHPIPSGKWESRCLESLSGSSVPGAGRSVRMVVVVPVGKLLQPWLSEETVVPMMHYLDLLLCGCSLGRRHSFIHLQSAEVSFIHPEFYYTNGMDWQ